LLQDNFKRSDLEETASSEAVDIDKIVIAARRQWKIVATFGAVGMILGAIYALTAVPLYVSSTNLLIDPKTRQIVDQLSAAAGVMDDEGSVLSQVEILSSQKIALDVVDKLDLTNNAEFQAGGRSPLGSVTRTIRSVLNFRSWFNSDTLAADREVERQQAANAVRGGLTAERVGRSYVLSISYTSPSAELSAKIANAIAESYLTDQLDSKYEATRRASEWLQQRIAELKQKALESDLAVQKFKSSNNLISTGGQLISDQQLTQLNSQLIVAQSATASAKSKYDQIQNIIKSGEIDASVTESLNSPVVTGFQQKYLDALRRETDIASRLGPDHLQAVRLRNEMQDYKRLMFTELSRIAEASYSTYQIALANEKSAEKQVQDATGVSSNANDAQVQLRQLERESETYKSLYANFLQRYQEATQQQSFPITEARVISKAIAPQRPSKPKKSLILGISLFAGLLLGAGAGGYREYRERYFRTGDQVRSTLDLEYLGQIPLESDTIYENKDGDDDGTTESASRMTRPQRSLLNFAIDHPLSSFAEALRAVRLASDIVSVAERGRIIGVVSALPGEGKSTISVNLAQLLAHQGSRVLLIDGDLRAAGASKAIAPHAERGLVEVLTAGLSVKDAILMDSRTRLAVLPVAHGRRTPYSAELLASPQMAQLLDSMRQNFDYVVIDLPPMGAVVDARAVAPLLDCNVLVTEWGKTPKSTVKRAIEGNTLLYEKCLGVILNKVDMGRIGLYAETDTNYYFNSRYGSYYREG
jgi:succinoglycan biosynthesis transport protein ExoP